MGLRARKREQARADIVDAAYRLFEEHGFDGTTVEMIAEEAFVSARTVYRYFPSKEEIVFADTDDELEDALRRIRTRCAEAQTIACLTEALAEHFEARHDAPRYLALARLIRDNPTLSLRASSFRNVMTMRIAATLADLRGAPRATVEDLGVAAVAVSIGAIAIDRWAAEDGDADLPDLARRVGAAITVAARGGADPDEHSPGHPGGVRLDLYIDLEHTEI